MVQGVATSILAKLAWNIFLHLTSEEELVCFVEVKVLIAS